MGRVLWMSSGTGVRRQGTTWGEISDLLEHGITVESIYERISCCGKDWPAREAAALLRSHSFDAAGVQEGNGGPVLGYVLTSDLQDDRVDKHMRPFIPHDLLSFASPLADALRALTTLSLVFVLGRNGVEGIITRADLNKPAARMYVFSVISLFEMHLTYWIRNSYRGASWRERLSAGRLEKAEQLQRLRQEHRQDLDLVDCLQFADKGRLIAKSDKALAALNVDGVREFESLVGRCEQLRNNLAHGQADLAGGTDWGAILNDISTVQGILEYSDTQVRR